MNTGGAYPCPYSVDNEAPTAFMVLPRVRDENWHFGVLVQDLLYTAIIDTLARIPWALLLGVILLRVIVAERISVRVIRRRVRWAGGR